MKDWIKKLLTFLGLGTSVVVTSYLGFSVATGYQKSLRSSMSLSQTTVPVTSMALRDGSILDVAALGGRIFLTVDPGKEKEEIIMCTSNNTSTLNFEGCTRGLAFSGTSTVAVSANAHTHNAGAIVTMSNVHYVYEQLTDKDSDESVGGNKTFTGLATFSVLPVVPTTTPTSSSQVASKNYVDGVIASGAPDGSETTKGLFEGATQAEMASGALTGGTGANLVLQPRYVTSTRTTSGFYLVLTAGSGYISSTFGGVASSLATLNSSALVVQNPASATTTPTINSIPVTTASTTDLNRWVQGYETQYTAGEAINASTVPQAVYLSSLDGKVYKASVNFTSSTFQFIGFVAKGQNVTTNNSVWVTQGAGAIITGFSGFTTGTELYVSVTGTVTGTIPSTAYKVARAISNSSLTLEKGKKIIIQSISSFAQATQSATTTINTWFTPSKVTVVGCGSVNNAGNTNCNVAEQLTGYWVAGTLFGKSWTTGATEVNTASYFIDYNNTQYARVALNSISSNAVSVIIQSNQTASNYSGINGYIIIEGE